MKLAGINIVSANPERLADFYRDVLGAKVDKTHGGPHRIEVWFGPQDDNSVWIAANCDPAFVPQTYHACQGFEFRVDNVDAEYERLSASGIEIKEAPRNLPWGYRFFHIKDPDGNGIDIVQKL